MSEASRASHDIVEVRSCKYDGRVTRRWEARLVERAASLLVFDAVFTEEIQHPLLGTIVPGTLSAEYYWTDRWYSIFRFTEPAGALRNFYCNVNTQPSFDGHTLTYIDLDIDVLVAPDLSFQILDEDEFTANAALYQYPDAICVRARESVNQLIALIRERQFPFGENRG
jgi:protein associated with RNAse G/E